MPRNGSRNVHQSQAQDLIPPPTPLRGNPPSAEGPPETAAPTEESEQDPEPDRPPGPETDHGRLIAFWVAAWAARRKAAYRVVARDDERAAKKVLELAGSLAVAQERALALLDSPDDWFRSRATLPFLVSHWNQIGSAVTAPPPAAEKPAPKANAPPSHSAWDAERYERDSLEQEIQLSTRELAKANAVKDQHEIERWSGRLARARESLSGVARPAG